MSNKDHKYPGYTAVLPPRVRYDQELPAAGKLLYAEISSMTDVTGYCWASNSYLGALIGLGKERAAKLVAQLERRGYIESEVLRDDRGAVTGRRIFITDLGLMRLPPSMDKTEDPPVKNNGTPPVKNNGTPPVKNNGRLHIEKNDIESNIIPPYNPPKGGARKRTRVYMSQPEWAPDAFSQLWRWYPTGGLPRPAPRGNKQKAIRAWDALRPSPELIATIADALARQAATEQWREGVGIPHLSTYLNNAGWEGWTDDDQ